MGVILSPLRRSPRISCTPTQHSRVVSRVAETMWAAWRGDAARRIKKELNAMMKDHKKK